MFGSGFCGIACTVTCKMHLSPIHSTNKDLVQISNPTNTILNECYFVSSFPLSDKYKEQT